MSFHELDAGQLDSIAAWVGAGGRLFVITGRIVRQESLRFLLHLARTGSAAGWGTSST